MNQVIVLFILIPALLLTEKAAAQVCNEPNSLVSIRKRKVGRTEYVIFNLKSPATTNPAVSTVQPPFTQDGSGNPVTIAGCLYKKVRFESIVWTCKTNLLFEPTYLVRQVKSIGQFEGIIEYVIGYRCNTKSIVSYSYNAPPYTKFVVRLKY